jgi:hypothetical protein
MASQRRGLGRLLRRFHHNSNQQMNVYFSVLLQACSRHHLIWLEPFPVLCRTSSTAIGNIGTFMMYSLQSKKCCGFYLNLLIGSNWKNCTNLTSALSFEKERAKIYSCTGASVLPVFKIFKNCTFAFQKIVTFIPWIHKHMMNTRAKF